VSHRKTILLPGYAGRLAGRGDAIAGPVSWRRSTNHTPPRRSRPRRVGRPFQRAASPRGYRGRRQRKYRSFTVLPRAGTALPCGHQREKSDHDGSTRSRHFLEFVRKFAGDQGAAAVAAGDVAVGDRLGLYHARWWRTGPRQDGTGRPHGHRCQVRQRVAGRPHGRRMCLPRPRPRPASRLRVQHSGNLSAKVVTRHGRTLTGRRSAARADRLIADLIWQVNAIHYRNQVRLRISRPVDRMTTGHHHQGGIT